MCLAVPMKVVSIDGDMGLVQSGGVEMSIALDLVDELSVGDYVIVHAGFAINQLTPEEAAESLSILARLEQSWNE